MSKTATLLREYDPASGRITLKRLRAEGTLKDPDIAWLNAFGALSLSGVRVSAKTAMGVATVYACVNVVAKAMASLPLRIYQFGEGSSADRTIRSEARDHATYDLLDCAPNDEMTICDFVRAMQGNLSLANNAFAQVIKNRGGEVAAIVPLMPGEIDVYRENTTPRRLIYRHTPTGEELPAAKVLHLRGLSQTGVLGLDLVSTVRDVIGLAMALEQNASRFFANSSRPSMLLTAPGSLSDKAYARLKEWLEDHRGLDNAHLGALLEEGIVPHAVRSKNREEQMDESRERQDKQICRVFGVPPHKVGILTDATYSNIESENISFVVDTLMPFAVTWEKAMKMRLLSRDERSRFHFEFDFQEMLRGNMEQLFEAFAKAIQWGWMNPNEVRDRLRMNPYAGGDSFLQPLNMQPVGGNALNVDPDEADRVKKIMRLAAKLTPEQLENVIAQAS